MRHWLFKSEPDCYSFTDLENAPGQTTSWDGVRNYQARNFMRDDMKKGDLGFFYHSGKNPEIAGIVEIVREGHPDITAQDPEAGHFDPKATPGDPRWYMVDVKLVRRFEPPVPRSLLRFVPELAGMELMKTGSRLSVQPVEAEAYAAIVRLADQLAADKAAGHERTFAFSRCRACRAEGPCRPLGAAGGAGLFSGADAFRPQRGDHAPAEAAGRSSRAYGSR